MVRRRLWVAETTGSSPVLLIKLKGGYTIYPDMCPLSELGGRY